MKKPIFEGVGTALITPFNNDSIDYATMARLIDRQISAGVGALIVGGTTGEAATLTDKERRELYSWAREYTEGKIPLILGTGSPSTKAAVEYTRYVGELGADGALVVTPYYNKGTREGIVRHYEAIAEATDIPLILYNVPTRTGVELDIELVERLCAIPTVRAIKEASGVAEKYTALSTLTDRIDLYAGSDAMIYLTLSLGGSGVISVVSNLYPEDTVKLCKLYFTGEREKALKIQHSMARLIESLFLETNPAPVKYAASRAGLSSPEMRLPMWLPTERCRAKIDKAVSEYEKLRAGL